MTHGIPWGQAEHAAFREDRDNHLALARVRALVATDTHNLCAVVAHTSLRQSASETPIQFLRRLITAYIDEAVS